jgi:hypothetical protein
VKNSLQQLPAWKGLYLSRVQRRNLAYCLARKKVAVSPEVPATIFQLLQSSFEKFGISTKGTSVRIWLIPQKIQVAMSTFWGTRPPSTLSSALPSLGELSSLGTSGKSFLFVPRRIQRAHKGDVLQGETGAQGRATLKAYRLQGQCKPRGNRLV